MYRQKGKSQKLIHILSLVYIDIFFGPNRMCIKKKREEKILYFSLFYCYLVVVGFTDQTQEKNWKNNKNNNTNKKNMYIYVYIIHSEEWSNIQSGNNEEITGNYQLNKKVK